MYLRHSVLFSFIVSFQLQRSYRHKKVYFLLCLLSTAGLAFFFVQHRIYCKPNGNLSITVVEISAWNESDHIVIHVLQLHKQLIFTSTLWMHSMVFWVIWMQDTTVLACFVIAAFSYFSACEYGIAYFNIGFHYTAAQDFADRVWVIGTADNGQEPNGSAVSASKQKSHWTTEPGSNCFIS